MALLVPDDSLLHYSHHKISSVKQNETFLLNLAATFFPKFESHNYFRTNSAVFLFDSPSDENEMFRSNAWLSFFRAVDVKKSGLSSSCVKSSVPDLPETWSGVESAGKPRNRFQAALAPLTMAEKIAAKKMKTGPNMFFALWTCFLRKDRSNVFGFRSKWSWKSRGKIDGVGKNILLKQFRSIIIFVLNALFSDTQVNAM